VNENEKYDQTMDREYLLKYFQVERVCHEENFYGEKKKRLGKIRL